MLLRGEVILVPDTMQVELLIGLLAVWSCLVVTSALEEGESCRFGRSSGICVPYSVCRPLLETLGGRINICTYNSQEAVVCCPPDYRSQLQQLQQQSAGQRISARKCKEYLREATPSVYLSSLKPNAEVVQKRGKTCSTDNKLIVGGYPAKLGEFPHMAALGYRTSTDQLFEFKCGGTLISDQFVLTAAHCLTEELQVVRLGDLNLVSDTDGADPQEFAIDRHFRHPKYSAKSKHNDIALLKLAGAVRFSPRIRPACLYQSANVTEQKLTATGYGAVESYGKSANVLLKVVLDQNDQASCVNYYSSSPARRIIDSQMCAGYDAGGKDTCQGDSGGPLQARDSENDCLFHVVAVTSYGSFCGGTVPGVYTRVGAFLPWIESIVWGAGSGSQ